MRQHNELEGKFHEHQEASQRDLDKLSEENRELTGRCSQLSTKLAQAETERDGLTAALEAARNEAASVLEAAREGVGREKDELQSQLAAEKEEKGKLQLELNLAIGMQDRCAWLETGYACISHVEISEPHTRIYTQEDILYVFTHLYFFEILRIYTKSSLYCTYSRACFWL
jgi:hypothetical protein